VNGSGPAATARHAEGVRGAAPRWHHAQMRIAAPIIEDQVNTTYRVVAPMQALARRGHAVYVDESDELRRPETLAEFDVVVLWRRFGDVFERLARQLADAGVGVVWDNDDDIAAIPKSHPAYKTQGGVHGHRVLTSMARMMRTAHVVTTSSRTLADRYREASGADVRVIENYLPDTFAAGAPRPAPRRPRWRAARPPAELVVGWVAATEHKADLDDLRIRAALERVLERHDDVRVVSVGLRLGLETDRYRWQPTVRFEELPEHIAAFDIGIAPLIDTRFNRARSNVKVKEYAALGVPWLASPIGPYADMGEQQGGRLVPDDGWAEALERLVEGHRERERLARRAADWGRRETVGEHAHRWEEALGEAVERARVPGG
jgi:glycosyltransferase involved in cell wall biosynthesis